ncbi:MAG: hypothetical protein WC323_03080 [Patescibacteria group bacterium]|jgi:hypothetical protein
MDYLKVAAMQDRHVKKALFYGRDKFIELAANYDNVYVRPHQGKSFGLQYKEKGIRHPVGLCEINPGDAKILKRGNGVWQRLNVSSEKIKAIKVNAGKIADINQMQKFITALENGIKEIK